MLRDYQQKAVDESWAQACRGEIPIIVSPTGSGKTYMAAALTARARAEGMKVLILTPRREILEQTIKKVELFGIPTTDIGIIMGTDSHGIYCPVQIASTSTLVRRAARSDACLPLADLLIIDEAHLSLSEKLKARVLDYYAKRHKLIIGMTATPARRSGHGLGAFFTKLIRTLSVKELIKLGDLVPGSYWGGSLPDMAKVAVSKGDWVMTAASKRCRRPILVGNVVQQWLRLAGDRHTICFCCDKMHVHAVADQFIRAGVSACAITDSTPSAERDALMKQFRARKIQILCNVGIASIGFDVPTVDCIIQARPTKSLVLHLQQIGRGLRAHDGKKDCMVLDHAGNVLEHRKAEEGQFWTLETGTRVQDRQAKKRKSKPVTCQECGYIFEGARECPECHWEIPAPKRDVKHVEADLVPITKARQLSFDDRRAFYLELKAIGELRGRHPNWPKANYKEKFKAWPAWAWDQLYDELKPIEPAPATLRWVKSRQIAWAKSNRRKENVQRATS